MPPESGERRGAIGDLQQGEVSGMVNVRLPLPRAALAAGALLVFGLGYVAGTREDTVLVGGGQRSGGTTTSTTMPDVRSLFIDDALEVLADAGIASAQIRVVERAAAGDPDRVVDQSPRQGEPVRDTITLTKATSALVPDVAGLTQAAAEKKLAAIGAAVETIFVFRRGAEPGTVLGVDPPAGAAALEQVWLTVAAPASSVYVDALELADSTACDRADPADADGHEHAFMCEPFASRPAFLELDLDGKADSLTLVFGVPASEGDKVLQFDALADGKALASQPRGSAQSVPLSIDVAGVHTLVLRVSAVAGSGASSGRGYLADARLSGGSPEIAALPRRS